MQQPGLIQAPAGWPGLPGMQPAPQAAAIPAPAQPQPAPGYPYRAPVQQQPVTQAPAQQGQVSPAQAFGQQLMAIAKTLEQAIPFLQISQSVLLDWRTTPGAQAPPAVDELIGGLQQAAYYHGATLGAIRRFLCGETDPSVLSALALGFHHLHRVHSEIRPRLDQLTLVAPPQMQSAISSLTQIASQVDPLLMQAGTAIQSAIGPQNMEAARLRLS